MAGTSLFAVSSLACGLADSQGLLVGARLAQGFGAAMMTPAALSILTTTFQGSDRHKALGVWAGVSGVATMVGLFFGGLLTQEFGWRWVFFISLPPPSWSTSSGAPIRWSRCLSSGSRAWPRPMPPR